MSLHTITKSSVKVKYWANRAKWIIYSCFKKNDFGIRYDDARNTILCHLTPFDHPLCERSTSQIAPERERVRGEREKMSRTWMFM